MGPSFGCSEKSFLSRCRPPRRQDHSTPEITDVDADVRKNLEAGSVDSELGRGRLLASP